MKNMYKYKYLHTHRKLQFRHACSYHSMDENIGTAIYEPLQCLIGCTLQHQLHTFHLLKYHQKDTVCHVIILCFMASLTITYLTYRPGQL